MRLISEYPLSANTLPLSTVLGFGEEHSVRTCFAHLMLCSADEGIPFVVFTDEPSRALIDQYLSHYQLQQQTLFLDLLDEPLNHIDLQEVFQQRQNLVFSFPPIASLSQGPLYALEDLWRNWMLSLEDFMTQQPNLPSYTMGFCFEPAHLSRHCLGSIHAFLHYTQQKNRFVFFLPKGSPSSFLDIGHSKQQGSSEAPTFHTSWEHFWIFKEAQLPVTEPARNIEAWPYLLRHYYKHPKLSKEVLKNLAPQQFVRLHAMTPPSICSYKLD